MTCTKIVPFPKGSVNLASSDGDGNVRLWGLNSDTPLASLPNINSRVPRVRCDDVTNPATMTSLTPLL